MKQKVKQYKSVEDEFNNNSYISEQCFYCQAEFIDIEDILVDTERDRYICLECSGKFDISVVTCIDY